MRPGDFFWSNFSIGSLESSISAAVTVVRSSGRLTRGFAEAQPRASASTTMTEVAAGNENDMEDRFA
jgi:hypothetical protein